MWPGITRFLKGKPMSTPSNPTTPADAARIQSAATRQNDGKTPPDSHASRAQSAADKHANAQKGGTKK